MKGEKIICDKCGNPIRRAFILRHWSGKNYCLKCKLITSGINPDDLRPLSKEKFNKMLEIVANTPALKYKELQERIKKEREKKKQEQLKKKQNTRSKKTSS